ncbi:MAG: glycine dehydrogenase subunit 2, partial [Actinomycetota bacterium]|nr:glycine dehydrogenase subunit 2 [Actinomycetota bacterium]
MTGGPVTGAPIRTQGAEGSTGTIMSRSVPGRRASSFARLEVPSAPVPTAFTRAGSPRLPEVSEIDLVRHYTGLSQRNYGLDTGFYPLGSCTMKYNPKVAEEIAALPGFRRTHPL